MGIVKGPYNWEDWVTMLAYKQSLDLLRRKPFEDKRNEVIKKHNKTLISYLQRETEAA